MIVNVLGTEYKIEKRLEKDDKALEEKCGYCDFYDKSIVIKELTKEQKKDDFCTDNIENFTKHNLRHEIIHAFLFESGLAYDSNGCSEWAMNEEMVDLFAIQTPKMFKAFKEVGCLE